MSSIKAELSISYRGEAGVVIRIEDQASGISFVELTVSYEAFGLALSSLQGQPATTCEVRGLNMIGLYKEHNMVKMYYNQPIPDKWKNTQLAHQILVEEAHQQELDKDGWIVSAYPALNTQNGHGEDAKGKWYMMRRVRYVPKPTDSGLNTTEIS